MSYTAVEDAVVTALTPILTPLGLYLAYQNGPEPATPYCMINVRDLDAVGREQISSQANELLDEFNLTIIENYQTTIQFEFTGKNLSSNNGGDEALKFSTLLMTPVVQQALRAAGLSYLSKSVIRRVPKLRETAWYTAFVIDVAFLVTIETVQQTNVVDSVSITGEYQNSVTTIVDSITIP